MEDGQGDWREENGGSALSQIQRDGPVLLPAPAALGVRHVQELRGFVTRRVHGWQRCGHVGQGGLMRAEGGGRRWRQEEMSVVLCSNFAPRAEGLASLGGPCGLCAVVQRGRARAAREPTARLRAGSPWEQ